MNNTKSNRESKPKVLLFDLETTAHEGFYWGRNFETSIIENVGYGKILCYGAKWLGKKTIVRGWIDSKNEKNIVKELWKLLDEADIVCAHNGRAFDIKWCNTKFIQYGLLPPSPYKVVDTKTEAKKYLYLPSYSLDNIADYFRLGRKIKHEGFSMWLQCIQGNRKAWRDMKRYCKQDVDILERVYLKLRPLMENHPPIGMYKGTMKCDRCGGTNIQSRGKGFTRTKEYKRTRCMSCGKWGQNMLKSR